MGRGGERGEGGGGGEFVISKQILRGLLGYV